jgi:hypothetical protein
MNITNAKPHQSKAISQLVASSFIAYDPLTIISNIPEADIKSVVDYIVSVGISNNTALIAEDGGTIVASIIAYDFAAKFEYGKPESFNDYDRFLKKLSQASLHKLKNNKVLYVEYLACHAQYYGHNLVADLNNALFARAEKLNYEYVVGEFTNPCHYYQFKHQYPEVIVLNELAYNGYFSISGSAYLTMLPIG